MACLLTLEIYRCGNIAWEFLFGVVIPTSVAQVVCFVPWLFIDVFIIYTTWKYGGGQWKQSPIVANNLGLLLTVGVVATTGAFWCFIKTVGIDAASFYLGYSDQFLISVTSVAQLLRRGNTLGHSWGIWSVERIHIIFSGPTDRLIN